MRKSICLAFPLTSLLAVLGGCAEPDAPPPKAPEVVAPPTPPPAPTAEAPPATAKLDAIPRLAFNRVAAELDLPLFWVSDANNSGAIEPDELAVLWGVAPGSNETWVEGGHFTPAFTAAYAAMQNAARAGASAGGATEQEKKRRTAVLAELSQGRPSAVRSDFRKSSPEDRAIVDHVMRAASFIEEIYGKQRGTAGMAGEIPAEDAASRMLFNRNQGPWCEAPKTEKDPDCSALARKPAHVSGLYPASIQQDPKFCEKLQARKDQATLTSPFTVVVEAGGELKALPYHEAYRREMQAISAELKAAAEAVTSVDEGPFKTYLLATSQAFLDGNWTPADEAWAKMNVNNSKWYLRIGPDEVYFEPCSLKAGFHVSFARINQDSLRWQKKLEPVKSEMEGELAKLAGAPYKARNVTFHLPDFIDIILNAGDSRMAHGGTIGQSLPNFGPVASQGRGRTVAMTNLYSDKDSETAFNEQVASTFCADSVMPFDPPLATMSTVLHEAAHNLGPAHDYKVKGKTAEEAFGGPLASTFEELKAQTSALYFADFLAQKGIIDPATAMKAHARDIAWAFGHISQGVYTSEHKPKPYSQLASIQVGSLLKAGAITWSAEEMAANGKDKGCFHLLPAKFPGAIKELEKTVLQVKGRADKAGAEKLREEFVDRAGEWKTLRSVIEERWLRSPKATFVYAVER